MHSLNKAVTIAAEYVAHPLISSFHVGKCKQNAPRGSAEPEVRWLDEAQLPSSLWGSVLSSWLDARIGESVPYIQGALPARLSMALRDSLPGADDRQRHC